MSFDCSDGNGMLQLNWTYAIFLGGPYAEHHHTRSQRRPTPATTPIRWARTLYPKTHTNTLFLLSAERG